MKAASRLAHYFLFGIFVFCGLSATQLSAESFRVPEKLRPRVDFWIDVFARYGKHHAIIHHRNYPQYTLKVLDFSALAGQLSDSVLEKRREKRVQSELKAFRQAAGRIAQGAEKGDQYEQLIKKVFPAKLRTKKSLLEISKDSKSIRSQRGIRERYKQALIRSGRYIKHMEKIFVQEFGLPREITRLPFIESSFVYDARSSAGATGIWQFMRSTGRQFLKINWLVDERKDVLASTRAAAKYMRMNHKTLGKWPLTITAYNHGAYGVKRKVKKLGTDDIVEIVENPKERLFGFASTNFYPEFLAAVEIFKDYRRYFPGLVIEPSVDISSRKLSRSVRVSDVVKTLDVPKDELKLLNPALSKNVWSGSHAIPGGYLLRAPGRIASKLKLASFKPAPSSSAGASSIYGGSTYKVRRGDSLWSIAKKYGTSVGKIKAINGLRTDRVRIGQLIKVSLPRGSGSYLVRRGDTLSGIASRHRMSVGKLRALNGIRGSTIRVGQRLKVSSSSASSSAASARARGPLPVGHKVVRGDTLSGISRRYGVSIGELKALNNLKGNTVYAGQTLKFPSSRSSGGTTRSYTVRSGDSLWSISKKFGSSIAKIKAANNLRSSKLKPGQKLRIP